MSDEIEDLPYVKSVTSMANTLPEGIPEEFLPYSVTSELHTKDSCRMLIYIRTKTESDQAFKCTDEIRGILEPVLSGRVPIWWGKHLPHRISRLRLPADNSRVNIVVPAGGVPGGHVQLPVVCHTGMMVMVPYPGWRFSSIWPCLTWQGDTMVFMGYIIVSSIQLGATVDYSILLTNNYVSCRKSLEKKEACIQALMLSCPVYFYFGNHYHIGRIYHSFHIDHSGYRGPGPFDWTGALFSVILVLTVLPALLVLFDRIITSNEWDRLQKYLRTAP